MNLINRQFLYIVLIFATMILNTGCFSHKNKTVKYPNWFYNIKKDTTVFYYGSGEGSSKKEAVTNALNEIASKVSVSISSTFDSTTSITTTKNSNGYVKTINKNVQNKVKKIEFSSYKVIKFQQLTKNKCVVFISVNRLTNAQLMLDKINTKIDEYNNTLKQTNLNIASKLKQYINVSDEITNKTLPDCFIAKSLYNDEDISKSIQKLLDIKTTIDNFRNSISFSIVSDNIKGYKDVIAELLSQKKFAIVPSNSTITIKLSVKEDQVKSMGNYIIKSKVIITAVSNGDVIATKVLIVGAKSIANYNQAKEFTLKSLKVKLKKQKVFKEMLGI